MKTVKCICVTEWCIILGESRKLRARRQEEDERKSVDVDLVFYFF